MSSLEIITYDIYDSIPIKISSKNDIPRELYYLDFTLKNVRGRKSTKPTKYFDDVENSLNHDFFIIDNKKRVWNKYAPCEPYHFENYMCGDSNAQLVNGYYLRDFMLRILNRFKNIPDLKIYIIDKDNVALEYSDVIPCCSFTRSRVLIEYYAHNLLRLLKVVNSEVAKELDEVKPQIATGFKTCDVDYEEFFKNTYIHVGCDGRIQRCYCGFNSNCNCYNCQCLKKSENKNLIFMFREQTFRSESRYIRSSETFKYCMPFKIIYDECFERHNSIRHKITYEQLDDEYWTGELTKGTIIKEEIKESTEIEAILNQRVSKLVKEYEEEKQQIRDECTKLTENLTNEYIKKLTDKNTKIQELEDTITKIQSSANAPTINTLEISTLKAENVELEAQNTTLTSLVNKLKKSNTTKDKEIEQLNITVSEQSAKIDKQNKVIAKLTACD